MDDNIIIELKNVFFRRGKTMLLKNLNWTIKRGQNWALLGPNGAGKTLILRLITGYIWPTDGQVSVLGHTLGQIDLRVLRKRIGWVALALADLIPKKISLLETILSGPFATLGLYEEPSPILLEKARTLATEFNLEDKLERPFSILSSGERQRGLLARAALAEPDLLILDEPMSNLDMGGRELFLAMVSRLAAKPKAPSIILTTHNTLEVGSFIDNALLIKNGQITAQGPLAETLTAKCLGSTFDLPLKVEKTSHGRYLAWLD